MDKQGHEFLEEEVPLGMFKISRRTQVENAVPNNQSRDSLKTEGERKYYDWLKAQLGESGYTIEERRSKGDNGRDEYTAVVKGDFKIDAGEKLLNNLKELAEKLGGELKQSSDKVASFYFGEKTKLLKRFQTAAKILFNHKEATPKESGAPKKDDDKEEISQEKNVTSENQQEEVSKRDQNSAANYWSPKDKVKQKLLLLAGKPITNKATGIVAFINVTQINKMISNRAVEKSVNNGFTQEQHLEATEKIQQLYEDAELTKVKPDEKKKEGSQDLKSVKIFHCPTEVSDEIAIAKITVKESFQHGHRVYSIELEELNKPTELENRTEPDSSAVSKDSTQKGDVFSTRHAEEPSFENIEVLLFDDSTHSSPVTATGSLMRLANNKSGVSYQGVNAISNIPLAENISQSANKGKKELQEENVTTENQGKEKSYVEKNNNVDRGQRPRLFERSERNLLKRLPMSPETYNKFYKDQLAELQMSYESVTRVKIQTKSLSL